MQAPTFRPTSAPTEPPILYPQLQVHSWTATGSTATVNMRMSLPGYLYCAAYSPGARVPTGSELKATAYPLTVTTSPHVANVTITGLAAYASYHVYCYSEDMSSPANVLPDALVAMSRTDVNTTCCYTLGLPTLPTALYERKTSSVLTASSPVSGVALTVNVTYCSGLPKAYCTRSSIESAVALNHANCTSVSSASLVNMSVSPSARLELAPAASFTLLARQGG